MKPALPFGISQTFTSSLPAPLSKPATGQSVVAAIRAGLGRK